MSTSENLKAAQIRLLEEILVETKRPGAIRCWFIGFWFPEFHTILGKLANLARITEEGTP